MRRYFVLITFICLFAKSGFGFDTFLPDNSLNFLSKDRLDYIRPPIIYSGKNKVSWKNLKWEKLSLRDSDVYYYDRIRPIIPLATETLEEHDIKMQEVFNYDIHKYFKKAKESYHKEFGEEKPFPEKNKLKHDRKNPVMLYGSHQVFEQTNTIYGFIPEGTGGFTEFLKGRVVLPYTGSNKDFVHVVRHEMVHAHNLQKIYQMWKDFELSGWNSRPPLWVLEGCAEWGSRCLYMYNPQTMEYELDNETKMYLRDATVNNLTPHLAKLDRRPGYLNTYKLSQSAINFIINKYGVEEFYSMYDNWYRIEAKKTKTMVELMKTAGVKKADLLNPGVYAYDEPFIIINGAVYDLHGDSDTYHIIKDGNELTLIDNIPVNDLAETAENIKLDDEWFMIYYDINKKYRLYNRENGWITKWKKKKVNKMVRNKKKALLRTAYRLDFSGLLKHCLGDDLNKISRDWQNHNKEIYYASYNQKEKLKDSQKLTRGIYDRFPVVSKNGRFLLYKSYNKQYYFNLNLLDTKTKKTKQLAHDNTLEIESIHILNAGNDIIEKGENAYSAIFSAQNENSDVIYEVDFKITDDKKIEVEDKKEIFDFDDHNLIEISNLKFSHDGKNIIFRGLSDNGKADIYTANLQTRKLTRVTDDYYDESSPDMMGDTIVFVSDRGSEYMEFNNNIFKLYLNEYNDDGSYRIEQITSGSDEYASTRFTEEGNIIFSSYLNGNSNIYIIDEQDQLLQLTDVYTGVFNPILINDELTVCGYNKGRYNIYQVEYSSLNVVNKGTVLKKPWDESKAWKIKEKKPEQEPEKYRRKYDLDYIGGGFILNDIEFSANFAGQLYFSDMLGNDVFGIGLLQPGDNVADMNFVFTYTNLSNRFKRSVGIFRIMNYYFLGGFEDSVYYADDVGAYYSRSYPINKSQNLSTSLILKNSSRYDSYFSLVGRELSYPSLLLATLSSSFVHDSTTWAYASPVEGTLLGILLDTTFNVSDNGKMLNTALLGDLRKYFRLSTNCCIAVRLGAGHSWGEEPHYFAMGSGLYMRGYDGAHEFKGTKFIMMNLELRGLIVDAFKVMIHNHSDNPIILGPFQGAIFCDYGYAWSDSIPIEPSGTLGLSFRFFPVYAPIYLSWDLGIKEFWPGGSKTNLNGWLRIRFSF